ncbi:hypothetical protein E4U55_000320 [Claviceps digitariae]|nr:hypothetical protein E4U55_000320 [Claviceps digitariae]
MLFLLASPNLTEIESGNLAILIATVAPTPNNARPTWGPLQKPSRSRGSVCLTKRPRNKSNPSKAEAVAPTEPEAAAALRLLHAKGPNRETVCHPTFQVPISWRRMLGVDCGLWTADHGKGKGKGKSGQGH